MKANIKKGIIILLGLLIVSILIEIFLIGYNSIIRKVFVSKHLIENQPHEINKESINYKEDDQYSILECELPSLHVYNVALKLYGKNEDVYMRLIYNNTEVFMEKSNKEQSAFRAYLKKDEDIDKIQIVYPKEQLEYENIDKIVINSNFDYLQKKSFSIIHLLLIYGIGVAIYGMYLGYKYLLKMEIKTEKAFLIIALIAGTILVFIIPPLATYDEHAHFWRAYEFANGVLDSGTQELPDSIFDIVIDKETGIYYIEKNTSYEYVSQIMNESLNKDQKSNHKVGATSGVSPLSYSPQIIGVFLGNIINLKPVFIVYLGRITNLLAYIALIFISIKIIPGEKLKRIVLLISVLPMSLNLAASLSPDAVIISCSILAISYILYLRNDITKKLSIKNYLIFVVLVTIVSMCKIVYLPFIFLLLLLPKEKFKFKRIKIVYIIIAFLVFCSIYLLWQNFVSENNTIIIRISSTEQLHFTLSDIERDLITGINTIYKFSYEYYSTMIGGWNTPNLVVLIITLIMFVIVYGEDEKEYIINNKDKTVLFGIVLIAFVLIFVGLYIAWTRAAFTYVEGVQGRYFLPLILPTLLILKKNKFKYKIDNLNNKMMCMILLLYIPIFIKTIMRFI